MQEIFDTEKIKINKLKQSDYTLYDEICKIILDDLEDVIFIHNLTPKRGLNLNPQNNFFTENCKHFEVTNIKEGRFDYICAPLLLHKMNNLDLFFTDIKQNVNPNGIFCGTFFGLENLRELGEELAKEDIKLIGQPLQRLLPVIDIKTIGMMLQKNGFKNIAVSSSTLTFEFNNLKQALQFIKNNGESNCFKMKNQSLLAGNVLKKILAKQSESVIINFDICFFSCLL